MNIDDWFQWPTRASDPAANAAIAVLIIMAVAILFIAGIVIALPLAIAFGIGYGIYKYANRPTPTEQIYAQTEQRVIAANFPTLEAFLDAHADRLLDSLLEAEPPAYSLYLTMLRVSQRLYEAEKFGNPLPPLPPKDTIEEGRYRDMLLSFQKKSADAPATLALFANTLSKAYLDFIESLPDMTKTDRATFALTDEVRHFATFPLLDVLPNPGRTVEKLITPFFAEPAVELGLFVELRKQFERNANDAFPGKKEPVLPSAFEGRAEEVVHTYLKNTPLEALMYAPIPFSFSDEHRYEHMHIVGGSGHGKTQLLQHLILNDLNKENPPSLIVIDSQGEMLRKIQQLSLFKERIADRLIIIDPEQYSPALNMFDTTNTRVATYSNLHREQLEAGVIELYNYIFAAIAAEMTSRQSTAFAFVARLMLSIPNATIHTLRELMEDPAPTIEQSRFRDAIERLDQTSRSYFQNQFFTKRYSDLKQQIARRLYGVLSVPAFDRMFSAQQNKLDMFDAMQSGKVVLVNTSKSLLKSDASALFGRYMIALAIRAVYERVAHADRHPAFLIVDEASEYFDDNIQMLLEQARKFNVGLVLAHQHLDQLSTGLRSAITANTAIKLAGGINDRDARALAPDMRTTGEFIGSMKKQASSTEFACYVRNYTANAVRLAVPFGMLENAPKMTETERKALIERNRARYSSHSTTSEPKQETKQPEPKPQQTPRKDPDHVSTDPATEW